MIVLALLRHIGAHFRRRRMQRLVELVQLRPDWRVLDVGGTIDIWLFSPVRPRLFLLNTPRATEAAPEGVIVLQADGSALPFPDQSFDLVFSNSVIEHLGSQEAAGRFAQEVRRVGRRYFIQTPDAAFPIEPHLYTPFLHYLPHSWQRRLAPYSVWSLFSGASAESRRFFLSHYLDEIRLLDAASMRSLFPGACLVRERVLGFSKSLIAIGKSGSGLGR